ncbi:MAG TPA: ribbon-helix-helix domain-containing protein [Leucothrix mucor]|uniref:Ribbon-helix-helix domain-containing protein n=1 Tax=Leucothrix mucor TaxID=45248 RepID=A0A7V2T418_LEUMU|nr:ribbon-helix-helix domain-containing protein [Leucothrix mucor]
MSTSVKTAISLQKTLFQRINELAKELGISRSRLFVMAIEDFIKKIENKKMLSKINTAYSDHLDVEDKKNAQAMRNKQKQLLEQDPW